MNESALRPPEPVPVDDPRVEALRHLIGIVDRLREPDGCPWDREQTEASMTPHLIEEAHELQEAVEVGDADECAGEAGDILLGVLLVCRIAMESGRYDLEKVARVTSDKLVRRHPHVFGDVIATDASTVLDNWEAIKRSERAEKEQDTSALAGVPKAMPALQRASRVCGKAVSAGFRWARNAGAFAKLEEEVAELREALPLSALDADPKPELTGAERARVEHELGDVLMATAFFGKYLGLDPEQVTREALRRFEGRFRNMEERLGGSLAERSLGEMMDAWTAAKTEVD
ncbi:MAG: nucleoside triphosphate pyrophosphohydrolase [bacterium]|nr:nucleoside triphosphate pyrophosphohydrolase [bacterium]